MSLITKSGIIIGALLVTGAAALRADRVPLDTDALATLAVQDHGRKKPFTTFARETLLTLSGKPVFYLKQVDGTEKKLMPEEVVLGLWFRSDDWNERPIFMLNFIELKKKLGLPEDRKLFSIKDLSSRQELITELLNQVKNKQAASQGDKLSPLEKEAEHFGERLQLFVELSMGEKGAVVPNPTSANAEWSS